MPRTFSVKPPVEGEPDDLDNQIVDGIESLRQRVKQAILFRFRTWMMDRTRGLNYDLILGHRTTAALAASTLSNAIREEGGAEVTGLVNPSFRLDHDRRQFFYSVTINTVYGSMAVTEAVSI